MIVVLKEISEKICEIRVDSDNADFIKNSSGLYESLDDLINEINEAAIVQGIDEGKSVVKYISVTNIIDEDVKNPMKKVKTKPLPLKLGEDKI